MELTKRERILLAIGIYIIVLLLGRLTYPGFDIPRQYYPLAASLTYFAAIALGLAVIWSHMTWTVKTDIWARQWLAIRLSFVLALFAVFFRLPTFVVMSFGRLDCGEECEGDTLSTVTPDTYLAATWVVGVVVFLSLPLLFECYYRLRRAWIAKIGD